MREKAPKFVPHTNRSMRDKKGRPIRFTNEQDYVSEMKRRGLEPYREITPPKSSSVSRDDLDHALLKKAAEYQRTGKMPGSVFIEKLNKLGVRNAPREAQRAPQGGWYAT